MGNALRCCPCRGRKVSVVLLSGEIAEFNEPVRAATVMKRYPQHVVLHCRMASNCGTGQQRRKIFLLKPEQALQRNQNYLVTPIQTARNAKPFLDSWAFFTISANRKLNAKIKQQAHRDAQKRRSWVQTLFDKIFRLPRSTLHSFDDADDDSRSLLRPSPASLKSSKSLESSGEWRPSLERITESPNLSRNSSLARYPRLDFRSIDNEQMCVQGRAGRVRE